MSRIKDIVVDAVRPSSLAAFWAEVLDGYTVRAYDAAEVARLADLGLTPETDRAVAVDGPGPTLFFQLTKEAKVARNRIHLDITCTSRSAEVARLEILGATVRDVHVDYTVMRDPEGNEFCVTEATPYA
ncbi:MAG: VOC family protein [Gammaproteobacteria bacterium]|nr:VOC family protein [Gammaproteobacteria bacterium]